MSDIIRDPGANQLLYEELRDQRAAECAQQVCDNYRSYLNGERPDFSAYFMFDDYNGVHPLMRAHFIDWLNIQPHPSEEDCVITGDGVKLFVTMNAQQIDGRDMPFDITYSTSQISYPQSPLATPVAEA